MTDRKGMLEEISKPIRVRSFILRPLIWGTAMFWSTSTEWRIKGPFLTRLGAHISIILLTLVTIAFVSARILEPRAHVSAAGDPSDAISTLLTDPSSGTRPAYLPPPDTFNTHVISRIPDPHTTIPQRPRARIITHTIQPGETLFTVADQFGLSPNTLIWNNPVVLQGTPWLIRVGTPLTILPVDGIYHTACAGETTQSIAARYKVKAAALYNEWNALQVGKQPSPGQRLVVPGGQGEALSWQPLTRYPAPGPNECSFGTCGDTTVIGPGGHGWFIYPTGQPDVSGWFFHDRRNPAHIGIDYRCQRGDPIHAADNGVVTIAGWHGTYGIMVQINHGNNFITRYGHFSKATVECGQSVYQGDLIGYCGNTGWSSGPHLHFEIRKNNTPQDPQLYLP
jgi:murein DD-endopeptidase MepM/ murein hydrolase activator NlpD